VDWTRPTAVIFGNEAEGVSEEAVKLADGNVVIPLSGFAQSLNISVAAAVTLHHARLQRIQRLGKHETVSEEESQILLAAMLLRDRVCADGLVQFEVFGENCFVRIAILRMYEEFDREKNQIVMATSAFHYQLPET
jgi:hypothetical protein